MAEGVRQLPSGTWQVSFYANGKRQWRTVAAKNQTEAEKERRKKQTEEFQKRYAK